MNVRVLLLIVSCVLTSGCCMPGMLMNPGMMSPGMMQCCPVGSSGMRPMMNPAMMNPAMMNPAMMNPAGQGLPLFRSFHSNLATTGFQNPQPFGVAGLNHQPMQPMQAVMSSCCPQPVYQQVCQPQPQPMYVQPTYVAPPVAYSHQYQPPVAPTKPWTLPSLPWKWGGLPKFTTNTNTVQQPASQRWIPVVNDHSYGSGPTISEGCGSTGSTFAFSGDGCGEEVPYFSMPEQTTNAIPPANLSPVPAPPAESSVRYFPNSGEQREKPVSRDSEPYYFDPPPAAEKLPEPPDADSENEYTPGEEPEAAAEVAPKIPAVVEPPTARDAVSPASKPAMNETINPFEDIEDTEPEASLPLEAEMSQSTLRIPSNSYEPLYVPYADTAALPVETVAAADATPIVKPWGMRLSQLRQLATASPVTEDIQATPLIRPVAHSELSAYKTREQTTLRMPWQSIELNEGFFSADVQRQNQIQPVQASQLQRREVTRHAVVRRSVVDDAEQLVPVRRVISRRKQ